MVGLDLVQVVDALQVVFGQGPTHGLRAPVAIGAARRGLFWMRTLNRPMIVGVLQWTNLFVPLPMASLQVKLRTVAEGPHDVLSPSTQACALQGEA